MFALLIVAIALIIYGSLYPWHFVLPHESVWLTLMRSWPFEWTLTAMRDDFINVLIYVPVGALAFLSLARRRSARAATAMAISGGLLLSLSMEALQAFVPGRTPSFADLACNTVGAAIGALLAWWVRKSGSRAWQPRVAPVLMLVCWGCYHEYPLIPSVLFSRMQAELTMWFHPQSVSPAEIWSYAAEWIATAVAVETLFGRKSLRWLPALAAVHFVLRPFIPTRPLVLDEILGILIAWVLWKLLPERIRGGPALLISVVLLRECFHTDWYRMAAFSWLPFQPLIAADRTTAVMFIARAMFDYTAIVWLWRRRGMSYQKSGAILASLLALLAAVQRYLPGGALSMTDPVLALLAALICYSAGSPGVLNREARLPVHLRDVRQS